MQCVQFDDKSHFFLGPALTFGNLPAVVQIPENTMHIDPNPYLIFDVKASIETNAKEPISLEEPNYFDVPLTFSFSTPQAYFNITTEEVDYNLPYTGRLTTNYNDQKQDKKNMSYTCICSCGLSYLHTLSLINQAILTRIELLTSKKK